MGATHVVVLPTEGEEPCQPPLWEGIAEAISAEAFPDLTFFPQVSLSELRSLQEHAPHGVMFLGMVMAKRPTELGRLTDLDLWNPREYKHDLLMPWHRALTKAKKHGDVPPQGRAMFLHHPAEVTPEQLHATILPMIRRIGLWTRFWNNHELRKASATQKSEG